MTSDRKQIAAPHRTGGDPTEPSFQKLPRRQVVVTMGGVMLGLFLAALDQTVVGTAMPRIMADLGGFDRFTWVTTSYVVASTTAVPIVGRLSDVYGRKGFYVAGTAVFLIGSMLSGLSQTIPAHRIPRRSGPRRRRDDGPGVRNGGRPLPAGGKGQVWA